MAWWPKRKRGKHVATPEPGHRVTQAVNRAADDLRESIMRRPEVDRLVLRVQQEFKVRSS